MVSISHSDWEIFQSDTARLIFALFRSRNQVWEKDNALGKRFDLTWAQFCALMALRSTPEPHRMLPTHMYDAVQITSGGLTKILDHLERRGLVVRVDNPEDGRSRFAQLTFKGKEMADQAIRRFIDANGMLFNAVFSPEEQVVLVGLLEKLNHHLESLQKHSEHVLKSKDGKAG